MNETERVAVRSHKECRHFRLYKDKPRRDRWPSCAEKQCPDVGECTNGKRTYFFSNVCGQQAACEYFARSIEEQVQEWLNHQSPPLSEFAISQKDYRDLVTEIEASLETRLLITKRGIMFEGVRVHPEVPPKEFTVK